MKYLQSIFLSILLCAVQTSLQAQVSFGKPEKINEKWQFYLGDNPNEETEWRTLNLPHDWGIEGVLSHSFAACTGYLPGGIGWYKKTFTVPKGKEEEKMYIYFEGIMNRSEVYLNGHLLGKRPNGYVSFMYDMTPYVEFGKENRLTVRVDHSRYADSRWYNGSGIYRNVWLVYANPIHIAQWGVFAYPTEDGTMHIEVEIENHSNRNATLQIVNELFDPTGKSVAKKTNAFVVDSGRKSKISSLLSVKNVKRWNLETPNLYTLKTTVLQGGKVMDETETTTAFRSFVFDADKGFFLNGQNLKMKGLCIHHDAGVLGAAVPREVWKRRLLALKSVGCNAIRMTHNLQNPDVYDLCDELGLLVMNEVFDEWEFPKRKWIRGWNVGEPGFQGAADYFEEWCERDLGDGVRRDRNHPCIFAWSIGNEVDYPNDPYSHPVLDGNGDDFTQKTFGGYHKEAPDANRLGAIAKRLAGVVKTYDQSRPVTAGLAGVAMSNETEYPFVLDICGYNYTENRYDNDHKQYPARVIYGSENRHDYAAWKAVRDNEHIFGQFLWTGIDYLGESGVWPSRGFYSGLLDFAGFIKPRGYFRKAVWTTEPMVYLGTYPNFDPKSEPLMDAWSSWNYEEGQHIRVVCYTNTEETQLFLNGKPIGVPKNVDDNTGIIFWDMPFREGKLEAVGYKNGKEAARYTIQTSGRPYTLTTHVEQENGLSQITVQVVDEKGVPVMLSDDEIVCTIDGNATLLGMEAGDNQDMGDYSDNRQRAYHGRLLAYIQTYDESVNIRFTAKWLKGADVKIAVGK